MMNTEYRDRHDLPCWTCDGTKSCSFFKLPEPHLNCFKCGEQEWRLDKVEEYMNMGEIALLAGQKNNNNRAEVKGPFPLGGQVQSMEDRGITKATADKFNVNTLHIFAEDGVSKIKARVFPFYNPDTNELVAQKLKQMDKQMRCVGRFGEGGLFGQNIFPAGGKYITITEGEEDAMAAWQMMKMQTASHIDPAVVSIKSGVSAAKRDCKTQWEYLNSFENIIICFDADEVGQKAAEEVAELFPKKSKIVRMHYKDANEYLSLGKTNEFNIAWRQAERVVPTGIIPSSKTWDAMTEKSTAIQVPYPWAGLNKKLFGMRTGELVMVKAKPKIGKTELLRRQAEHIKKTTPYNVGIIFLEETLKRIALGFCAFELDRPIYIPDVAYTEEELREAYEKAMGDDRYFIFDPKSERTAENVLNKITYFAKAFDCKFIFLDHVSMLVYDLVNSDERKVLDKLLKDLKDLAVTLDVHITAVQHVNDEGKTRGSRAAYQLCDAMLDMDRDKLNPDPFVANTTILTVEENRISGDSGEACKLYYDRDTGKLMEVSDDEFALKMSEKQIKNVQFDD